MKKSLCIALILLIVPVITGADASSQALTGLKTGDRDMPEMFSPFGWDTSIPDYAKARGAKKKAEKELDELLKVRDMNGYYFSPAPMPYFRFCSRYTSLYVLCRGKNQLLKMELQIKGMGENNVRSKSYDLFYDRIKGDISTYYGPGTEIPAGMVWKLNGSEVSLKLINTDCLDDNKFAAKKDSWAVILSVEDSKYAEWESTH